MNKRPDQYQMDPGESTATDYKFRRQSEDSNRRKGPEQEPANRAGSQTPNEAMEARRQQSEQDRNDELERAREVQERGEGGHGVDAQGSEGRGDLSEQREAGAGPGSREERDDRLGTSGQPSHHQGSSNDQRAAGDRGEMNVDRGRAHSERAEREMRDREELGRPDMETQSREMQDDVLERREREAREQEER